MMGQIISFLDCVLDLHSFCLCDMTCGLSSPPHCRYSTRIVDISYHFSVRHVSVVLLHCPENRVSVQFYSYDLLMRIVLSEDI